MNMNFAVREKPWLRATPAKAARTILTALDAPNPPLRLVLGGDAVDSILERLHAVET